MVVIQKRVIVRLWVVYWIVENPRPISDSCIKTVRSVLCCYKTRIVFYQNRGLFSKFFKIIFGNILDTDSKYNIDLILSK